MSLEKIETASLGIDNLGQLRFESAWKISDRFLAEEIIHAVNTYTIFVEPEHVLYWHNLWGNNSDGLNSIKRFSHMLSLRAVPLLDSTEEYEESLATATASRGIIPPKQKRLQSLVKQAGKYIEITSGGERVSRIATSTARILFRYNPPSGEALVILHDYILGL